MIYLVLLLVAIVVIAAEIGVESWFTRSRSTEDKHVWKRVRIRFFSGIGGYLSIVTAIGFLVVFLSSSFFPPPNALDFTVIYYLVAATAGGILFVALVNRKPKSDPPHFPLPNFLHTCLGLIGGYIGLFMALLASIFVPLAIDGIVSESRSRFPAWYTDPLKPPTVVHLCEILQLGIEDERCQGEGSYFLAFLPDIQDHYGRGTPRERVDAEIGSYLVICDEWVSTESDGVFQTCYYDFGQDGTYALAVSYHQGYPNNFDISVVPTENSGGYVVRVSIPFINPSDRDLRRPVDH